MTHYEAYIIMSVVNVLNIETRINILTARLIKDPESKQFNRSIVVKGN